MWLMIMEVSFGEFSFVVTLVYTRNMYQTTYDTPQHHLQDGWATPVNTSLQGLNSGGN